MAIAAGDRRTTPITAWLAASALRLGLAAWLGGALAALALPPLHVWPGLLGFAVLLHLLRRTERRWTAFALGWAFGFGYFVLGLYWIAIAFFSDAERFGALAFPAVTLLCAGMALYPALAAWLTSLRRWRSPVASALVLAIAWIALEALRARLFGGFPWNLVGYAWSNSLAISQLGALTGIYGLSFLAVVLGALPAGLLEPGGRSRWWPVATGALALGLVWAGGAVRLAGAHVETVPDVRLRLVQANVPQADKWRPEMRNHWFGEHLRLSSRDADGITDVIWPESASPYPLEQVPEARALIARVVPQGGLLLTGGERYDLSQEPPRAWNSLFVVDDQAVVRAHYDKADLVPFGEFLPLDFLLRGVIDFFNLPMSDFAAGADSQPPILTHGIAIGSAICYEIVYPDLVAERARDANVLLTISNDTWFGRSIGPLQHLQMARLRALENGRYVVRATSNGVTAIIDDQGRLRERAPQFEPATVVGDIVPMTGLTPFTRTGSWPTWLLSLILLVPGILGARRTKAAR